MNSHTSCGEGGNVSRRYIIGCQGFSTGYENLTKNDRQEIDDAIDAALAAYLADYLVVYSDDEVRLRLKHAHLKDEQRNWDRSHVCMYPDCNRDSIKRSHTIPRGTLRLIAEDGHLVAPRVDQSEGCIVVEKIGINRASIFPGFCAEHENIFQQFESSKKLSQPVDFALQIYRTICRELVKGEHTQKYLEITLSVFKEMRDEWFREEIQKNLGKCFVLPEGYHVHNVEINVNDVVREGELALQGAKEGTEGLRRRFLDPFVEAMGSLSLKMPIVHLESSSRFPVALSGRGNFHIEHAGTSSKTSDIIAILNVTPREDGTDVFLAVSEEDEGALQSYLGNFERMAGPKDWLLCMVESWMLNGSDHWFMTPSAWEYLDSESKARALSNILSDEQSVGELPQVPILDAARRDEV